MIGFGPRLMPVQLTVIGSPAKAEAGTVIDWITRSEGGGMVMTIGSGSNPTLLFSAVDSKTWLFASVRTMR